MILIDKRVGSGPLLHHFPKGSAQLTDLRYGDFAFTGNGPEGMPYSIGVERKTIREIAGSLGDGRLVGHQLPGMLREYQVVYLMVEGAWRGDRKTGVLRELHNGQWRDVQNGSARFMATDSRKFLATIEGMLGVRLRFTPTPEDTVQEVVALHSWWTHKEWEEHRSHLVIQGPGIERTWFRKPSILQSMVACLPGIGWKRSGEVAKHFTSPLEMVQAGITEWCEVEGIGKGIAAKVVNILQQKGR